MSSAQVQRPFEETKWKTIVVKYSPLVIGDTESRLSTSFPKKISIESESDVNLLGSDN
ncbi:hypothetical protein BHE74_00054213 [Ensete ventricosum]|nr:hypothetical protein GW17_00050648 [Ensete ventricosum]RWW40375.1 hypothetical protein BHE74_00054213 [Ensete ventricosum]RZS19110.1 hypothetical protein BHM03_00051455 [Ensete ventricosum]